MSKVTDHGNALANQIQGEDAYGYSGELTVADVWLIIDNLHSHFMDNSQQFSDEMLSLLSDWMAILEDLDEDLPI